jgi:amidophosphoribosyltransferase
MSKLKDFVAFRATIELLHDKNMEETINQIYYKCKEQLGLPKNKVKNVVKDLYAPFSYNEVSNKISELLKPKGLNADLKIIYQSISGLHKACPSNTGDWYFSGDFPTAGGNIVVNKAFINYYEKIDVRAY